MANVKKAVFKGGAAVCLFVLVTLFFSILQVADSYGAGCVQPPSGMVSWWGGDNNALDMVGSNDGTLMGGATFAAGMVGQAFSFDGVDDYVELPAGFADFTSGFTVALWANPTASGSWARFIDLGNGQANDNILFDRRTTSNDLTLEVYNEFGSTTGMAYSVDAITNNEWHHYAATLDAFGKVKLFKDGLPLVMAADTTGVPNNVTRVSNYIGKSNWSYDAFYAGSMDEVQIFNRALDAAEIAAIYNAGSAGECRSCTPPPSGMASWWGGDNNALDMVGSNDGTLMGGATYAAGMVGQAFSFDGNNQYVEMPGSVGDFGTAAFSVDFWMYTSDTDVTRGHYILGKSYPDGGQGWDIRYYNSTITVEGWSFEITSPITLNAWHHVAVSATVSDITLYIDGTVKGTSGRPAPITSTSNPFRIGYTTGFWPYTNIGFNGLIDEVEIFNRALSASEIAAIYNAGSAGKCISTSYSVTATAGAGGSLDATTPSPATVNSGATATFIFNANTGYHVATITDTCGGEGYTNTSNNVNTYTYVTPAITGNCGVSATFPINVYTVTATANGNGTGTVSSNTGGISYNYPANNSGTTTLLNYGTSVVLTAAAGAGSAASWNDCTAAGGAAAGNGTQTATCTFNSLDGAKNVRATFTRVYSISGRVSMSPRGTSGGVPISGVTITLSGTASGTTTSDANGNYLFTMVPVGAYKVTPSNAGYTFTPNNRSVNITSTDVTGQDFMGMKAMATYAISGTVRTTGGAPMAGVGINLSGAATGATTTDANGRYRFPGLVNGSYTVTPIMAGYTCTPANRNVTLNGTDVTGQDFTGIPAGVTYSISGTVRTGSFVGSGSLGAPVPGVTITLSGAANGTITTDANGNYSFTDVSNGNYLLTPSLTGSTFTPASRDVTINNANVTGQNFTKK